MNPQAFSEWFSSLSQSERISALALIYSDLTVGARELFAPEWTAGKEKRVLNPPPRLGERRTLEQGKGSSRNTLERSY